MWACAIAAAGSCGRKKQLQKFKPEIANRGSAIAKVDAEPETIGRRSRVSPGFGGIATVY
jgi:hypothetical protein